MYRDQRGHDSTDEPYRPDRSIVVGGPFRRDYDRPANIWIASRHLASWGLNAVLHAHSPPLVHGRRAMNRSGETARPDTDDITYGDILPGDPVWVQCGDPGLSFFPPPRERPHHCRSTIRKPCSSNGPRSCSRVKSSSGAKTPARGCRLARCSRSASPKTTADWAVIR